MNKLQVSKRLPGRPKLKESEKKEKTKTIRIPISRIEEVIDMLSKPKIKPTKK